jgi:glycosyltransferase 2 family protein
MPRVLRLIVGLGLLVLAFWLADPAAVLRAGASADPRWLLAAVLLVIPDRALMAYRWVVLLRPVDPARRVPLSAILRVFFVSTFVGTFLPSIGGDAARAYGLSRHEVSVADAAASVVMDRVLGAWSLLVFAFGGLTLTGVARHDAGVLSALAVTTAGCVGAAAVLYSDAAAAAMKRVMAGLPMAAVRRSSERLFEAVRRYGRHHGVVANVTIGSLLVQALRILQAYCLGRALGIDAPLALYFALIPWTLLVMLVPISVNGLGTSQVAFVYLFGLVGVPGAQAFALSVLCVALGAVGNLPGGFIYAFRSGKRQSQETGGRT